MYLFCSLHRKRTKSWEGTAQSYRDNNKENLAETSPKKSFHSKNIEIDSDVCANRHANIELSELRREVAAECIQDRRYQGDIGAAPTGSETPSTLRRRRIIDKNVNVSSTVDLNASELLKECEDDYPRLNYSYSNVEDSDLIFLQGRLGTNTGAGITDADVPVRDTDPDSDVDQAKYSRNLDNPGNSRKIAKFIRETKKPKSILLSTSNRENKVCTVLDVTCLYCKVFEWQTLPIVNWGV